MGNQSSSVEALVSAAPAAVRMLYFGGGGDLPSETALANVIFRNRSDIVSEAVRKLTEPSPPARRNYSVFRSLHAHTPDDYHFTLTDPKDRAAALAAMEVDPRVSECKPWLVPKEMPEEAFFYAYFSHILFLRGDFIPDPPRTSPCSAAVDKKPPLLLSQPVAPCTKSIPTPVAEFTVSGETFTSSVVELDGHDFDSLASFKFFMSIRRLAAQNAGVAPRSLSLRIVTTITRADSRWAEVCEMAEALKQSVCVAAPLEWKEAFAVEEKEDGDAAAAVLELGLVVHSRGEFRWSSISNLVEQVAASGGDRIAAGGITIQPNSHIDNGERSASIEDPLPAPPPLPQNEDSLPAPPPLPQTSDGIDVGGAVKSAQLCSRPDFQVSNGATQRNSNMDTDATQSHSRETSGHASEVSTILTEPSVTTAAIQKSGNGTDGSCDGSSKSEVSATGSKGREKKTKRKTRKKMKGSLAHRAAAAAAAMAKDMSNGSAALTLLVLELPVRENNGEDVDKSEEESQFTANALAACVKAFRHEAIHSWGNSSKLVRRQVMLKAGETKGNGCSTESNGRGSLWLQLSLVLHSDKKIELLPLLRSHLGPEASSMNIKVHVVGPFILGSRDFNGHCRADASPRPLSKPLYSFTVAGDVFYAPSKALRGMAFDDVKSFKSFMQAGRYRDDA